MLLVAVAVALVFGSAYGQACDLAWTVQIPGRVITGRNTRLPGRLSLEQCKVQCEQYAPSFVCVSIEYTRRSQRCVVSDVRREDVPAADFRKRRGVLYSERTEICPGCLFEWQPVQAMSILMGRFGRLFAGRMSADECKSRCEQETSAFCASINYLRRKKKCFLLTATSLDKPWAFTTSRRFDHYDRVLECPAACLSSPCQNGGQCFELGSDYRCRCVLPWGGKECQYQPSTCYASGDPHYKTFDDLTFDFMGVAKYLMAQSTDTTLPQFKIYSKNEYRGGYTHVSYVRYMEVELDGHVVRIGPYQALEIDGAVATAPVNFPTFTVKFVGLNIRIETYYGLIVESDTGTTSTIKMPPQFRAAIEGMCGNNDGDSTNDFIDQQGTDVTNLPGGAVLFGNSWMVTDPQVPNPPAAQTPVAQPCTDAMLALAQAADFCGLILDTSGPFTGCIGSDPNYADVQAGTCAFDTCITQNAGVANRVSSCANMESFAIVCRNKGYPVDWRTAANCPVTCPTGRTYVQSTTACPASCLDPNAPATCTEQDGEDCVCPAGTLVKGDACVDPSQCGCYDNEGNNYDPGQAWTSETCEKYSCDKTSGQIVQLPGGCTGTEVCVYDESAQANICSEERSTIELVGGSNNQEGRVEVIYRGQRGTICDDTFDVTAANVVCQILGFTSGIPWSGARFGPGQGLIGLGAVECLGGETDLLDCLNSGWGADTACTHDEDASVVCLSVRGEPAKL